MNTKQVPKQIAQAVEPKKLPPLDFSKLKFSFDLSKATYTLDVLQNKMLESYLRLDKKFRQAFMTNYTNEFLQFIKDKARMKEPVHLSVMGMTRQGKSYISTTLCIFHQACYRQEFSIDYICGNSMEFLEKLKTFPEDKLYNRIFLIDEEKTAMQGYGSVSKKLKLQDTANIIAMNNISTIMLNPISFANKEAFYGLRIFGKSIETKTTRMMLYNLQEKGHGGSVPLGNIFLPIFTAFLPKEYADDLEQKYLEKKRAWIRQEMRGENDLLAEIRKKSAENFMRDKNFLAIKKKNEKLSYIVYKMGSEWTTKECEDILQLTKLLEQHLI